MTMRTVIIYFAIKYKNNWQSIYDALTKWEFVPLEKLEIIQKAIDEGKVKAITIIDDDYPNLLKECWNPPFIIYYECKSNILTKEKTISLVNNEIAKFGTFNIKALKDFINNLVPGTYSTYTYEINQTEILS